MSEMLVAVLVPIRPSELGFTRRVASQAFSNSSTAIVLLPLTDVKKRRKNILKKKSEIGKKKKKMKLIDGGRLLCLSLRNSSKSSFRVAQSCYVQKTDSADVVVSMSRKLGRLRLLSRLFFSQALISFYSFIHWLHPIDQCLEQRDWSYK